MNLGCPKNLVDSERMAGELMKTGWMVSDDDVAADILVINTCSFIEDARREAVETIMEGIQWKSAGEGRRLFIAGCLPQRYGNQLHTELPEVDGFFGVGDYDGLISAATGNRSFRNTSTYRRPFTPRHYRYLRIADGCDRGCAYCAIPFIRGRYRSRPLAELAREAEALVEEGARELIIVAQEINSYGIDLSGGTDLISLLKELADIDGLLWIRLMYLHPPLVEDNLIDLVASEPKICPYFDFPIEHINDDILRRMGRRITRAQIEKKLKTIRRRVPGSAVRTSIMVGFPGEGESEFAELADFIEEGHFDRLGVFVYSPEENTKAYSFEGRVHPEEAALRLETIMEIQREISLGRNNAMVGREIDVLVDEIGEDNLRVGRTLSDAPEVDNIVSFRGSAAEGELVRVSITEAGDYDLQGMEK